MTGFSKFKTAFRRKAAKNTASGSIAMSPVADDKKGSAADTTGSNGDDTTHPEPFHEDPQRGVEAVEAMTLSWSRTSLIAVFIKYAYSHC
jgi:hypothetical protein